MSKFILSLLFLFPSLLMARPMDQVATGYAHSCLLDAGQVACWGWNFYGQLGNGTKIDAEQAKPVKGLAGAVSAIALGDQFGCAIIEGGLQCWGKNTFGSLGNGTLDDNMSPQWVRGLGPGSGVTQISAHHSNACAVVNGGLLCWGWDWSCLLGRENCAGKRPKEMALSPEEVLAEGSGITDMAMGAAHACAVQNGGALCWGSALLGRLGDGQGGDRYVTRPKSVVGLGPNSGVSAIAVSERTSCAVVGSKVMCWGDSNYMGVGVPDSFFPTPQRVKNLPGATPTDLVGRHNHFCASYASGEMYCWGSSAMGQIGSGLVGKALTPLKVDLPKAVEISSLDVGEAHTCAVVNGQGKCWGWSVFCQLGAGQCGEGHPIMQPTPIDVK